MKHIIKTDKAPAAIGPYSQGMKAGNLIFTSGQLPVNMATGVLETDITAATKASLENCRAVIEEEGGSMDDVVKSTVFLADMSLFPKVNEEYAKFFSGDPPARSCVQVASLPKGAIIEIELIASV